MVRHLNVDGDGQGDLAGHGGEHRAVFVYQIASYDYWRKELGRAELAFGAFGENFTVDGLADTEVCIGDRYRIGNTLLEVSQPRVTCYRVGIRLDEPRMAALLVEHGRPGFYCRVLEEGDVGAGDEIVQVLRGPEQLTVADVDALLYKPGHPADRLERALRIPALSSGWLASFRSLLDGPKHTDATGGNSKLTPAAGPAATWTGFRRLRVVAKTRDAVNVTSLRLAAIDDTPLLPGLPGQFIALRLRPTPDARALLRSYSLSGAPGEATYRVSVKCHPASLAGAYIQDDVRVGDVVEASAPRGQFTLQPGDGPVVLLSAGIGATPVLAMLHALATARSAREVWWVNGARNGDEQPFGPEVGACLAALPHAHRHIRYSSPTQADRPAVDFDAPGRISMTALQDLNGLPQNADFYLCGPAAFMTALTASLMGSGVAAKHIHTELFGAGPAFTPGIAIAPEMTPHTPRGEAGAGPMVSFGRSGLSVRWRADFGSLLDLAEACDVPVRWSCRSGVCHSCATALIDGSVSYRIEPIEPPAAGDVLICCCAPKEDIVIDL